MLEDYFSRYMDDMDRLMGLNLSAREKLIVYWQDWLQTDSQHIPKGHKCLAVKLGSEVSDLSDSMREVLDRGTREIIRRLSLLIDLLAEQENYQVPAEGSLLFARNLYQLWIGASMLGKISGDILPLQSAMTWTRRLLES